MFIHSYVKLVLGIHMHDSSLIPHDAPSGWHYLQINRNTHMHCAVQQTPPMKNASKEDYVKCEGQERKKTHFLPLGDLQQRGRTVWGAREPPISLLAAGAFCLAVPTGRTC